MARRPRARCAASHSCHAFRSVGDNKINVDERNVDFVLFLQVRMGKCEMSRKYTIYYTSATSATPKNDDFYSFSRSQNDVETDRRPSGSKMVPKCCPRASRAGPEPKIDSKRVPKGVPRGCQNDPEIAFWKVLGHRCDAKGLQGVSGHPPRLKMQPTLSQHVTKNYRKTLLCFREFFQTGRCSPLAAAEYA